VALRVGQARPRDVALAEVGGAEGPQPGRLRCFVVTGVRQQVTVTPPPAEAGGFSLRRVGVATDQPGP
jgi:hypothetical protein